MPVYTDFSETQAPPLRVRDVCDWLVTEIMPGVVSLHMPHVQAHGTAITFTPATLPQLRQVVALLEGKQ